MADKDVQKYGAKTRKVDARMVVGIVILVLLVAFILQNRAQVELSLLVFDFTVSLWVALGLSSLIALAVGFLLGRGRYKT